MTDTQKPFSMDGIPVDANGWCHDMALAPRSNRVKLYLWHRVGFPIADAFYWAQSGYWESRYLGYPANEISAWRLPPAPPVKGEA